MPCEHERRLLQAAHELMVMRGNGVIDLNRIQQLLETGASQGPFSMPKEES